MGGARGGVEDVKNPIFKTNWLTLHLKFFPKQIQKHFEYDKNMSVNKQRVLENKHREQKSEDVLLKNEMFDHTMKFFCEWHL